MTQGGMKVVRPPSPFLAVAEVTTVAAAYIVVSIAAVETIDLSFVFPESWPSAQRTVGSGFLVGALVQLSLVLLGAYLIGLTSLRFAISKTFSRSTRQAWTIALIATAIHVGTAVLVYLPQPERVWEASSVNLILSAIPATDAWTQEVLFRGYVLIRLARARIPRLAQIFLSGLLFAAIHVGYVGEGVWATFSPLIGTFMLGVFYAWSVQSGRGSLLPVVFCHMLIILLSQPWLALAS
ncbi:CPBP family intramembrane glutamic endopeptidase [Aurantiacibacter hainanensis]|uniref:CPBP family intramembrane glutamic endopeptidase n=1 Tax=Aurantiacibacter hainanensis TaxID=3076114 RepID=UPI0030C6A0F4